MFWAFTSKDGVDRNGTIPIPGRAVLRLPAGQVDVNYAVDLTNYVIGVPQVPLAVTPLSGGARPGTRVQDESGGVSNLNGVSYALVATMHVPAAGRYAIEARGEVPGVPNPRLEFGISSQHFEIMLICFIIAGVLVLLVVVSVLISVRSTPRVSGTP